MRRTIIVVALTLLGMFSPCCSVVRAEESRTWTDKSGKFSVNGEFVEITAGKVRLKLKDGKVVTLPLAKLSEGDRVYVRDLLKQRREEAAASGGYGGDTGRDVSGVDAVEREAALPSIRTLPGAMGAPSAAALRPSAPAVLGEVSPTDVTGATKLVSGASMGQAPLDPTPLSTIKISHRPILLGPGGGFFEDSLGLSFAADAPVAIAAYVGGAEMASVKSRIQLLDLAAGKVIKTYDGPLQLRRAVLSPSGKRIITLCGESSQGVMDVWSMGDAKLEHVISWQPYAGKGWSEIEPDQILWIDDERVATVNRGGLGYVWQISGAKALFELDLSYGRFALSPGRKQLAVLGASGKLDFFDIIKGEHLARVGPGTLNGYFSFSPSGQKVAVVQGEDVTVLKLPGGEVAREIATTGAANWSPASWVGEEFLFTAGQMLVDIDHSLTVWQYRGPSDLTYSRGAAWMLASQAEEYAALPFAIPHPEVRPAIAAAASDASFVVKPGIKIMLDIQVADPEIAEPARASLMVSAKQRGFKIVETSPIRLVARTQAGPSETRTYQRTTGGEESVAISSEQYILEIFVDNELAWVRANTRSNDPGMMVLAREGQSIQDVANENASRKGNFFPSSLPAYVLSPKVKQPLGKSMLTAAGMMTVPVEP